MNENLKEKYVSQLYKDTACWSTKEVYEYFAEIIYQNEQLQQENKQLKERTEYLERSNNRREETILEYQKNEYPILEELEKYIEDRRICTIYDDFCRQILDKIKKLEEGVK